MAKFAKVGYGSQGQGLGKTVNGYTYIVNDNVRTGDMLQPVATSRAGKKFVTTGRVRHAYKETSAKGQNAKQEAQENGAEELTRVYTGKEVGAGGLRYVKAPQGMEVDKKNKPTSEYAKQARAGNLAMYMQEHPNATLTKGAENTFDSYSKRFMNKGEQ